MPQATRRTQPYRRGPREQGQPLQAMRRGKPASMPNPMDTSRQAAKGVRRPQGTLSALISEMVRRNRR